MSRPFPDTSSRRRFLRSVAAAPAVGLADAESFLTTPRPAKRWQFETNAELARLPGLLRGRGPAVGDTVVVGGEDAVYGLDRERGTERWLFPTDGSDFSLDVGPETVYVAVDDELRALDPVDGTERWQFDPGRGSMLSVEETDPRGAYVRTSDALCALDGREGLLWRATGDFSDALVRGRIVYAVTSGIGSRLSALDVRDGSERWRANVDEAGYAEVVGAAGDAVYVHVRGRLYAFDAEGTRRWKRTVRHVDGDRPPLVGTVTPRGAYVWDEKARLLRALDPGDGSERWRFDAESDPRPGGLLAEVAGTLYAETERGVHALDPDRGTRRWSYERGSENSGFRAHLAHGRLYAVGGEGIVALDAETAERIWQFSPLRGFVVYAVPGGGRYSSTTPALYAVSSEGSVFALEGSGRTPPAALARAAERNPGLLALGGAVGGGLLATVASRFCRSDDPAEEPDADRSADLELVELLDAEGSLETYRGRRRRAAGTEPVVVQRLAADADDETAASFVRAARAWAALDHEGIRPVLDVETDPPRVVCPPAAGTVQEDVSSVARSVRAVAAACEAVHAAHRSGTVHGRLAPDRLKVSPDASADAAADGEPDAWVDGWTRTAATDPDDRWAPPEAEGETVAGDVYRLGAAAYALSAGGAPPEDSAALDPGDFDADRGDALADVLGRALAPDPADRYDSALKLADALRWAVRSRQRRHTAT